MTQTATQQPPHPPPTLATVADVMRPPLTTASTNDHVAAAAYLMKHARATALMVLDAVTGQPEGILTEADIAHAAADGKDLNEVRIRELMTIRPTVINPATSVRDAAQIMTRGIRIVKRKLKKIQYRPHLIDGCLAATGLKIEPW